MATRITNTRESFEERVRRAMNRTPAEIAVTRDQLLALSLPPRPLPEGKTLEDVVVGALAEIPEEEADLLRALKRLS